MTKTFSVGGRGLLYPEEDDMLSHTTWGQSVWTPLPLTDFLVLFPLSSNLNAAAHN